MSETSAFTDFDVADVLSRLTTLEKATLLSGKNGYSSACLPQHGIPSLRMSDGPSACRGTTVFNGTPSNCYPCSLGLGASFDIELVADVAGQIAKEARAKNVHVLLAPTVNLVRSPLAGRGFEFFSEDPYHAGMMGAAHVKAVQAQGISACLKHFIANEQETEKHSNDSIVSPRALREVYLEPFRIVLHEASPLSIMTSYNRLNGLHTSEDKWLLHDVLRQEWNWKGTLISDWYGTYSCSTSIKAGLDIEMPGPALWRAAPQILSLLEAGKITTKDIDACATRVLSLVKHLLKSGLLFEDVENIVDTPESRNLLRRAAADAIVLLKNDAKVLPIDPSKLKRIAVIGLSAAMAHTSGGGAASVPTETFTVSPLAGIKGAVEPLGIQVDWAPGTSNYRFTPPLDPYLVGAAHPVEIEFWRSEPHAQWKDGVAGVIPSSAADHVLRVSTTKCFMHDGVPEDIINNARHVRLRTIFKAPLTGQWKFGISSIDQCQFFVDGTNIDYTTNLGKGELFFGFCHEERSIVMDLRQGQEYTIELRCWATGKMDSLPVKFSAGFQIGGAPALEPQQAIVEAVELAQSADITIVVVGLNKDYETEGNDRDDMDLPGTANDLVKAILATSQDVVVVNQSGMPVTMPWADDASTLLQAFYGGSNLGNGLADVLFGKVNPSGKLPVTFPRTLGDTPTATGYGTTAASVTKAYYQEDIFVGYRHFDRTARLPLFPFGHGLSYTTFEYSSLTATNPDGQEGKFRIQFTIKNTGHLFGKEAAQVYVADVKSSVVRPCKELKAFRKVALEPGQASEVVIELDKRALSFWEDSEEGGWRAEAGVFEVLVGPSSASLPLKVEITLERDIAWRGL